MEDIFVAQKFIIESLLKKPTFIADLVLDRSGALDSDSICSHLARYGVFTDL